LVKREIGCHVCGSYVKRLHMSSTEGKGYEPRCECGFRSATPIG
jgi:hypothetical protein